MKTPSDCVAVLFYIGVMSTIELPEDVAAAEARGTTVAGLNAEMITEPELDAFDAFIGVGASGRTGRFDIHSERAEAAARHIAESI